MFPVRMATRVSGTAGFMEASLYASLPPPSSSLLSGEVVFEDGGEGFWRSSYSS